MSSNREHGEGRPDIVLKDGNRAIILELKCLLPSQVSRFSLEQQMVRGPAMMNALLDEAETQIRTKHYIEGLMFESPNIAEVKAYAVCFCKNGAWCAWWWQKARHIFDTPHAMKNARRIFLMDNRAFSWKRSVS